MIARLVRDAARDPVAWIVLIVTGLVVFLLAREAFVLVAIVTVPIVLVVVRMLWIAERRR